MTTLPFTPVPKVILATSLWSPGHPKSCLICLLSLRPCISVGLPCSVSVSPDPLGSVKRFPNHRMNTQARLRPRRGLEPSSLGHLLFLSAKLAPTHSSEISSDMTSFMRGFSRQSLSPAPSRAPRIFERERCVSTQRSSESPQDHKVSRAPHCPKAGAQASSPSPQPWRSSGALPATSFPPPSQFSALLMRTPAVAPDPPTQAQSSWFCRTSSDCQFCGRLRRRPALSTRLASMVHPLPCS